jgi:hypothetical protein
MLNFHDLYPVVNNKYSFVGIEKCNSKIQLCLPKGFQPSDFDSYDSKRNVFFIFYKVLRQFQSICIDKNYCKDDRDGLTQNQGSKQKITLPNTSGDEELILYSKLDSISAIIDLYDELKILSLAHRLGISEKIDYSKIHKYLHACTYLNNGAAYIDFMSLPRQQVLYQSTDIVGMYCYILSEIKQQLQEEVNSEVKTLADNFSNRYIGAEYSLFNEEYCTLTIDILKDSLEIIEHHTPLKDFEYWQLYDAIELFLYGDLSNQDEGKIWGISNFHSVWESICLTYLVKNTDAKHILHLDTTNLAMDLVAAWKSKSKVIDINSGFTINGRTLVPDAVILSDIFVDLPVSEEFTQISLTTWDDFGYSTRFEFLEEYQYHLDMSWWDSLEPPSFLKIAHVDQVYSIHTFEELKKVCNSKKTRIIISSQLPSQFYSYWGIKEFDKDTLSLMKKLNHLFYLAIKNNIHTSNDFLSFLNNKRYFGNTHCLKNSVLRYGSERGVDYTIIGNKFKIFRESISPYLQILDIKYLDESYFVDDANQRELKERSVRKQFVYEYLLQQQINQLDEFKKMEIKSKFWLPCWHNDNNVVKTNSKYLDGYIELNNINFKIIVNSYFD